jgi:hypothetical protein
VTSVCPGRAGRSPARQDVPAGRPPARQHKWDVIRHALDDNDRTIRLCVILLVMSVAAVITATGTLLAAAAVHAWLG